MTSADSEGFVVERALHLGLRVAVGKVYTASDLRSRCDGDGAKLRRLENFLVDPTMLRPVVPPRPAPQTIDPRECDEIPRLDDTLTTFVINLRRRPDRKTHITKVCQALGVHPTFIDAVDGRELAERPGSMFKAVDNKSDVVSSRKGEIRGFKGLVPRIYEASWQERGVLCKQRMRMAEHRVLATEITGPGHELWGAVGCNRSHQAVLRCMLETPGMRWALVLEDDATLTNMPGCDARALFARGMNCIASRYPQWSLVYLGGVLSSVDAPVRHGQQLDDIVAIDKKVYQTHAYLIRRDIAAEVYERLQDGLAADAAFVSWSRGVQKRCFIFTPNLLSQPGGSARMKDSDIFVEGERFKRQTARKRGREYVFRPRAINKPARADSAKLNVSNLETDHSQRRGASWKRMSLAHKFRKRLGQKLFLN